MLTLLPARFLQTDWGCRQIHFSVTIEREAELFTPGMLIFFLGIYTSLGWLCLHGTQAPATDQ